VFHNVKHLSTKSQLSYVVEMRYWMLLEDFLWVRLVVLMVFYVIFEVLLWAVIWVYPQTVWEERCVPSEWRDVL